MDTRRKNAPCLEACVVLPTANANFSPRIDSSRNEKRLVRVNSVMQGWTEGVVFRKTTHGPSQVMLNEWNEGMKGLGLGDFPNCIQLFVGLQLMAPGESRRFWIPAELAFGTNQTDPASAWESGALSHLFRYTAPNSSQGNCKANGPTVF